MPDNDDTERDFHHPYQPYDIQKDFMNAVYGCLESGKVGIFESPTGTGKSLSLICGSLTWLRDHKRQTFEDGFATDRSTSDEPDWILEHAQMQKKQEALRRKQELHDRIAKVKAKERRAKERFEDGEPRYKRQKVATAREGPDDEAQFALDDYESDEEYAKAGKSAGFNDSGLSAETRALMEQLGFSTDASNIEDGDTPDETKIFFCSRTHSQLTQFTSELSRVKMPPAIKLNDEDETSVDMLVEDVKHLTLGSRKNLCVNSKVSRLGNATAINERCVELQQATSTESRCPHMPNKENESLLHDFRDHALAKIRDIEDLGTLGKKLGICPYYASRPAIQHCERSAREALGLSLKDHVVIIDEAHNLMDAIAGIYSVSVTLDQVQQAREQLTLYLQRFRNKLKGKNRVYVAQTIRILDSILVYLNKVHADVKSTDGLVDMLSIMSGKGVDQVNIFKLNTYLQESRLARKVDGYTTFAEGANEPKSKTGKAPRQNVPVLMHVQAFLLSLMNPSAEGRFFYSKEDSCVTLRYMLLDPTYHFQDIVEDARAVVLAGGTMSPMSDYEQHLLAYLDPSKILKLSCGHVIPPSNLLAVPVVRASSGTEFDFTFESRNQEKTITNLGHAILTMAQHIPDGLVVFFPSYSYLDKCMEVWKRLKLSTSETFFTSFTSKKPVFLEQRSQQSQQPPNKEAAVNSVLTSYSAAIAQGSGGLLFAVIGGTLSEGINFSDALGRGVVVVGLPFPNPQSAEWKAKMQYISAKETKRGGDGKAAARDFFENACMRAVNQCVGRAIRHKGDYAAILMLDRRYGTKRIQDKLPKWIRGSLTTGLGVQDVERKLDTFFASRTVMPPWQSENSTDRGAYTMLAEPSTAAQFPHLTTQGSSSHDSHDQTSVPNEESSTPDQRTLELLPRVSAPLPLSAYLIATVELCERFAYYGLSSPFQNYIANTPSSSPPGALGLGQSAATALTNAFQGWCYLTPLFGAVVADQWVGKYVAIRGFAVVYMFGIGLLFISSLSAGYGYAFPGLVLAMGIIGLGTGGIKPNVSPMIAEQITLATPTIHTDSRRNQVLLDPDLTTQKVFMVFYTCINLGSILAVSTTLLEQHVSFSAAYLLPLVVFILGFVILLLGRKTYITTPPQGGVFSSSFRLLYAAARHGWDLDGGAKGQFSKSFVQDVRQALCACKIFVAFPVYWCAFGQMSYNLISQASQLSLHAFLPPDSLPTLNPLSILLLIPLFQHLIYPSLPTLSSSPILRIALGFAFASLAMLYAAGLQFAIDSSGADPSSIHVAAQIPVYVLIATSEILASITGLEVAYTRAPAGMKSFVMSLFLLTSAGGSLLGVLVSPLARDPWLGWMYVGLGVLVGGTGVGFWMYFRGGDGVPGENEGRDYEMVSREED
ncbi:helicase C-terminal domain-containing protein [Ampelomyces quisqualis]|uniref:ATP-dependent DNA helicase CHL1 n=1 Tax=Ampelomyces quisqualis TaxID=50730 RepID=A0A6A5QNY8_AMPQU|nr:helicase C-terminal domain-containing protein [Ampelomyces quisqualis]